MALGGLDGAAAFANVVAHRLFDVDILAGLHGPDGGQRMPMVGSRDDDEVDGFVVEDGPQILSIFWFVPRQAFFDLLAAGVADFRVDVADEGDLNVGALEQLADVLVAAAVAAEDAPRSFSFGLDGCFG